MPKKSPRHAQDIYIPEICRWYTRDMPKIQQNLRKFITEWLTDSPTWSQEILAHLKTPSSWNPLSSASPKVARYGRVVVASHHITFHTLYLPRELPSQATTFPGYGRRRTCCGFYSRFLLPTQRPRLPHKTKWDGGDRTLVSGPHGMCCAVCYSIMRQKCLTIILD